VVVAAGPFRALGLAEILSVSTPDMGLTHNCEMRFPWIIAQLEKDGLAMQRATLIVNIRSRSGEKVFFRAIDLRNAELVRDRLEGQDQLMGSYPGPRYAGMP
jgi:hypothetical protein